MLKILKRDLLKWGLNFISNIFCPYERLLSPRIFFTLRGKWTFKARHRHSHVCRWRKKKKSGLCPLHICVMIPYIVFHWPWQIVHGPGLERQHWQHDILEQTKRLSRIMGCCCSHVIWEGVVSRSEMGVCLDTTAAGTPPPPAMEDDTGKKVECSQKQVPLRAALKGGGPEGVGREKPNYSKRCWPCTRY